MPCVCCYACSAVKAEPRANPATVIRKALRGRKSENEITITGVNSKMDGDANNTTTTNGSGCTTSDNGRIMDTIVDMNSLAETNAPHVSKCSDVIEGMPEVDGV